MSDDLSNLIYSHIERYLAGRRTKRYGLVTSYDPEKHLAKVKIQPEDVETGWLPIATGHIGNGWGIAIGLTDGDQVEVTHQEGDFEAGSITARVHSDDDQPPNAKSGELVLKDKNGTEAKFAQDGSFTVSRSDGTKVRLTSDGRVFAKPAAGKIAYLGCDDDDTSDTHKIVTEGGPSECVFARVPAVVA